MSLETAGPDEPLRLPESSDRTEKVVRQRPGGLPRPALLGIASVIVVVVIVAAFSFSLTTTTPSSGDCPGGQIINGAGSTFVAPLMDAWESNYTTAAVNYEAVGSGTGVEDLQALAVEFAASDAPLTSFQSSQFTNPVLTMPEAAGAVAVIYHLSGLSAPLRVNGTWLALAFMGSITNWNSQMLQQLNPGVTLPNEQIVIVHRSDGSGTSYVFQQFLSQDNAEWSAAYNYSVTWLGPSNLPGELGEKGSSGVSQAVTATPWTLSYVDLTYALNNGLPVAAVENPSGNFLTPTLADTSAAISDVLAEPGYHLPLGGGNWSGVNMLNGPDPGDYPLATFTYLIFYEHPDSAWGFGHIQEAEIQVLVNFLNWTIHSGQLSSSPLYYSPLPAEVVTGDLATIALVTWGGNPIGICR